MRTTLRNVKLASQISAEQAILNFTTGFWIIKGVLVEFQIGQVSFSWTAEPRARKSKHCYHLFHFSEPLHSLDKHKCEVLWNVFQMKCKRWLRGNEEVDSMGSLFVFKGGTTQWPPCHGAKCDPQVDKEASQMDSRIWIWFSFWLKIKVNIKPE